MKTLIISMLLLFAFSFVALPQESTKPPVKNTITKVEKVKKPKTHKLYKKHTSKKVAKKNTTPKKAVK